MFKKSFVAVAIFGAFALPAQAFDLPWTNVTDSRPGVHPAAGFAVNKNFEAVGDELDRLNGAITDLASSKNTFDQVIGNLEAGVEQAGQLADRNKQDIAANKTQINQNKQDIASNTEAIKQHYAEMKNNFAAVNGRIDDLDEEMKKGFASQAALNGLFQPYSVGKFNLSVALGGYESEQAMALGTGYRFNENFAMKAGIASDIGGFDHVTYNIGANFEW